MRGWPLSAPLRGVLAAALVLLLPACASQDEARSLAEDLKEDSRLLFQLASYEASERNEGVRRVKSLGQEQGTWLCLYILQEPTIDDYRVEVVLARLLADWKDPRAIGYLLQSLKLPDDGAVRIAAEGLLVFKDNAHVAEALREMLSSSQARERLTAAEILSRFHTAPALEILAGHFRKESEREIRAQILVELLDSKAPQRKAALIDALVDPDAAIREAAWTGLKDYPDLPRVAYDPEGPLEERARCVADLRLWQQGKRR